MRRPPTRIEQLDAAQPGLKLDVDLWLDENYSKGAPTLEEICGRLGDKYSVEVAVSVLSSYKQRRWWPRKARMTELRDRFEAINAELGERGVPESTQALIVEELDKAIRSGASFDAGFLLKEQRLWEQQRLKARELEVELERLKQERESVKEAVEEASAKAGKGEPITPQDINRIRERVFGLPANE